MKCSLFSVAASLGLAIAAPTGLDDLEKRVSSVQGFDISNYQPTVNFKGAYASGARFVIIKVRFRKGLVLDRTDNQPSRLPRARTISTPPSLIIMMGLRLPDSFAVDIISPTPTRAPVRHKQAISWRTVVVGPGTVSPYPVCLISSIIPTERPVTA